MVQCGEFRASLKRFLLFYFFCSISFALFFLLFYDFSPVPSLVRSLFSPFIYFVYKNLSADFFAFSIFSSSIFSMAELVIHFFPNIVCADSKISPQA